MKKKINIIFCLFTIMVILVTVTISMLVMYNEFKVHVINDLKFYAKEIVEEENLNHLEESKQNIAFANIRVTLIDQLGNVLYESDADSNGMENHSNRPEFKDAIKNGYGIDLRNSKTIGSSTFYYAVKLEDGNVLRVSREASSILPLFMNAFTVLILFVIGLIIICFFISRILTKRLVKPIEVLAENIENIDHIKLYDELIPLAKTIKEQHSDIKRNMQELERESKKMQLITNNMSEGLLFLDKDKNILSLNESAINLLSLRDKTFIGQNILSAVRNNDILNSIDTAKKGESNFIELSLDKKQLQIFSNPIMDNEETIGILCFILDITEKYNRDKLRREFTANVSHELKTPLTSITGYSELIKLKIAKEEDVITFATKIYNESKRLLDLINDIIKLSELDEGAMAHEYKELYLLDIVKECVHTLENSAKKRNITITVNGKNEKIFGNHRMISELIYNLIDNSIRYNKEEGLVAVEVMRANKKVILSVKDTGIGIPQEYKERVFERFFRVDKSRSKATGGTGLGLSIVKHIATSHNATIECKSQEGVGTQISVFFNS